MTVESIPGSVSETCCHGIICRPVVWSALGHSLTWAHPSWGPRSRYSVIFPYNNNVLFWLGFPVCYHIQRPDLWSADLVGSLAPFLFLLGTRLLFLKSWLLAVVLCLFGRTCLEQDLLVDQCSRSVWAVSLKTEVNLDHTLMLPGFGGTLWLTLLLHPSDGLGLASERDYCYWVISKLNEYLWALVIARYYTTMLV